MALSPGTPFYFVSVIADAHAAFPACFSCIVTTPVGYCSIEGYAEAARLHDFYRHGTMATLSAHHGPCIALKK